ncbi:MAG: hypothetical protein JO061_18265 [Acidobacteriaceae bacterium]|nr:hypothetical protein [Acidobacteriaceae bacterium]
MRFTTVVLSGFALFACVAGELNVRPPSYRVLQPITEHNLTVFPVIADKSFDTSQFLTLDEGLHTGQVTVTEVGQPTGLLRPRPQQPNIWDEHPYPVPPFPHPLPAPQTARVNTLALINNSDRPLILLAGEIVTGGKQDRVVGKDRIIPAHREMALDVFCVEPNRWVAVSSQFQATVPAMAQPELRMKAMAKQNQQEVWDQVAKSRAAFAANVPTQQALEIESGSSYAGALQNRGVRTGLDSIAVPIQHSYEKLMQQLQSQKAVGAVVAVNGRLLWADVFASSALLEKYWPKLIRSYAAEALAPDVTPTGFNATVSQQSAQSFLEHLYGGHESIESEPGIYRDTKIQGDSFEVFLLTSLLPNTGFEVHIAKMQE